MIMWNRFILLGFVILALGCTSSLPVRESYVPYARILDMKPAKRLKLLKKRNYRKIYPTIINILEGPRPVLDLYRQDMTHEAVIQFFVDLIGSAEIAMPLLYYADIFSVPALPLISLVWVESRFDKYAINVNQIGSVDRGLFQLNSRTFSSLDERDFFDAQTNVLHGVAYLRYCLKQARNIEEAIAMYNAGIYRVKQSSIPESTQRHVWRIMNYNKKLTKKFQEFILSQYPVSE